MYRSLAPYFLSFSLFFYLSAFSSNTYCADLPAPKLLLAKVYQSGTAISDYWISEKLDGVRAYWNGKHLISRQGNIYHAPQWFIADFPPIPLDGELWINRRQFAKLSGIVRKKVPIDHEWHQVSYQLFDLPPHAKEAGLIFTQRLEKLRRLIPSLQIPWLQVIPQYQLASEDELMKKLQEVLSQGGEGLMLHHGNSRYESKRSNTLLKFKPVLDAEAVVIKTIPGKGKFTGMMGSLLVQNKQGKQFRIGSGFSDRERRHPPAIGATITYAYSGITKNGLPRFARFIRERKLY